MKRIKQETRSDLQTVMIIIMTFVILFGTSFLMDLEVIYRSIIRSILVIILMLMESFVGFLMLRQHLKNLGNLKR